MQKLIFIHPSDELYGADRMLLAMIEALPDDCDVEVWLPNDLEHPATPLCQQLEERNIPFRHLAMPIMRRSYQTPRGLLTLLARCFGLVRRLRATRADIVYCTTSAAFLGAPMARLAGVPLVIGHFQEIWSPLEKYLLGGPARTCHRLLAISSAVVDALPVALRGRTVVVPNGTVDPGQVEPLSNHHGPLRFVIASRWNAWKGHRTLLDAWEKAGSPGSLVILGDAPPIGEAVPVRELVNSLSKPESVSIVGETADPSTYLIDADVVVMPSDRPEPFGLVAIEAFARGRPVIGSAAGGLLDVVTHDKDGWLFTPTDSDELASLIRRLTRAEVISCGARARVTFEQRFRTTSFASNWRRAAFGGPRRKRRSTAVPSVVRDPEPYRGGVTDVGAHPNMTPPPR